MIILKVYIEKGKSEETEVYVYYKKMDKETKDLIDYVNQRIQTVVGYQNDRIHRILIKDIYYIEYVDEKTFLYLDHDVYLSHKKLYEWEKLLEESSFIRVNKSTILNIHYLKSVRPLLSGRMEAKLMNGEHLIINRHYLSAFKKKFGL